MEGYSRFVSHIALPKMREVKQIFNRASIADVAKEIRVQLNAAGVQSRIRAGDRVALTAGSRGIHNIDIVIREVVRYVREHGAEPFIVPAMGSHGGATQEGQLEVLTSLGITEEFCGCSIISSMETVLLGHTQETGLPVYMDEHAASADSIILIGRIKPHPSFNGPVESGLAKMAVIGLGKQKGASYCHSRGIQNMSDSVQYIAKFIFERKPVIFGVGVLENTYDETARIAVIKAENILAEEPELLKEAYRYYPAILIPQYDVLLVEEMGKNISGAGMDTIVISRYTNRYMPQEERQQTICVLDLTEETHGNANGMGLADVAPKRFLDKVVFENTYPNVLTSKVFYSSKLPMIVENDKVAIQAAVHCCANIDYKWPKLIWMKNTMDIGRLCVSEALWEEAEACPQMEFVGEPFEMVFDAEGNLQRLDERLN